MDSVQYEYLRINKYLMNIMGQWPYQNSLERILISIFFIPIVTAQMVLQGGGIFTALYDDDVDVFMEGFAPFISSWMCLCKLMNYIINHEQMKQLLNVMQEDWRVFSKTKRDYDILLRYYAVGKKITVSYAVSLYGSMTPFMALPVLLTAADAFGYHNVSIERTLMFRLEHMMDVERYHYPLLIHSELGTLGLITIAVGIDTMMVFYVQHECGICEILGRRLGDFVEADGMDVEMYPDKNEDQSYRNARECAILHKHIIEFARNLEDANTMSFIFQVAFNMLGLSVTLFQASVNMRSPNDGLRFGLFTVCLLSTLLLDSWPGQQLSDHTDRIFIYITSGKWYQSSINTRRILSIMLSRSFVPIKLTAGKIYVLNLQNFSAVVRTSFSYFTVLSSLR